MSHSSADPIEILHEESHFMLINKPAGLFSQAGPGIPSVETELKKQLQSAQGRSFNPFIGLPHRLDRATSGIMLIARNRRALSRFGDQFRTRKVQKDYLAVLAGRVEVSANVWAGYLRKIEGQAKAEVVWKTTEGAKLAKLKLHLLCATDECSLVRIELLTGRMHQIRLQAAARGHTVLDDPIYGSDSTSDCDASEVHTAASGDSALPTTDSHPSVSRHIEIHKSRTAIGLHAYRLAFHHPKDARLLEFFAPIPARWRSSYQQFQRPFEQLNR